MSPNRINSDALINESNLTKWHSLSEQALYEKLGSSREGLSQSQATERLVKFGKNILPEAKPPTLFLVIIHQFKSPLIYILIIAAIFAIAIGDVKDAIFIFAVVILNAIIGTIQEWNAEQKAHALQSLLKIIAKVRRDGTLKTIPADELVPGDIVLIESGDKVPADLRLILANNLAIDESFLTGESIPVEKYTGILKEDALVSDLTNMAFAGATVITGRGVGIVVSTGLRTEVGKIARSLTTSESAKPPLLIRMEQFARQVSFVVLAFAVVLGIVLITRGSAFKDVFLLMVAMVVSAIPEGLPVAMTVALSIATSRMAKRNVIVRKLMAVESLGSCTTIASDKTGTLTVNQQTLKRVVFPDGMNISIEGQGYNDEGKAILLNGLTIDENLSNRLIEIAKSGIICNEAFIRKENGVWHYSGDAMDIAILFFARKLGLEIDQVRKQENIIAEMPFEPAKRYAATAYKENHEIQIVVKGAVETILSFSETMRTHHGDIPLDINMLQNQATHLAGDGYRVLAIATKIISGIDGEFTEEHLKGLTVIGLFGFIDPLRPAAKQSVQDALNAGVRVIMITGDHPLTALAIAKELGIAHSIDDVMTGQQLDAIYAEDNVKFTEKVRTTRVFARVTPEQKLQIVDALVKSGEFVAVTGDGVNDAPALRRANIGVAMGSGTDIAKETALITITDDNFSSIVAGIEEGRFAYSNVRKVTLLLISTGAAELILLGSSIIMNLPVPMLPVQILWLNLVTNGIQDVALAFEAGEKGVMKQPPRKPNEGIFNRKMIEQVLLAGLAMGITCLVAWIYLTKNINLNDEVSLMAARNQIFTLLVLMQFYHVFNSRSETVSAFKVPFRNNPFLIIGTSVAFLIHLIVTNNPFMRSILKTCPLNLLDWLSLGIIASVVLLVMETYKYFRRHEKTLNSRSDRRLSV